MRCRPEPESEAELRLRASALAGRTLGELAAALGADDLTTGVRGKGKVGELLEAALGATAGAAAVHDFPALKIELKTVPVDEAGRPLESTYVCRISLVDADEAEWETSWVRSKLGRVLWLPIITPGCDRRAGAASAPDDWRQRVIGTPLFWSPTPEQEALLRADFEEAMGLVGCGAADEVTAHLGEVLQLRPKAAHSGVRTLAFGPEGEPVDTVPRGFYLRPRFTAAILRDPRALP